MASYAFLDPRCRYALPDDFEYADVFPALMSHDKAFLRNQYGGPHIGTDVAYHIENRTFVAYLEGYAERLGIVIYDDLVAEVRQDDAGVGVGSRKADGALIVAIDVAVRIQGDDRHIEGRVRGGHRGHHRGPAAGGSLHPGRRRHGLAGHAVAVGDHPEDRGQARVREADEVLEHRVPVKRPQSAGWSVSG